MALPLIMAGIGALGSAVGAGDQLRSAVLKNDVMGRSLPGFNEDDQLVLGHRKTNLDISEPIDLPHISAEVK